MQNNVFRLRIHLCSFVCCSGRPWQLRILCIHNGMTKYICVLFSAYRLVSYDTMCCAALSHVVVLHGYRHRLPYRYGYGIHGRYLWSLRVYGWMHACPHGAQHFTLRVLCYAMPTHVRILTCQPAVHSVRGYEGPDDLPSHDHQHLLRFDLQRGSLQPHLTSH